MTSPPVEVRIAEWLGANALAVYLATLAFVLVAVWLAWRMLGPTPHRPHPAHGDRLLILRLLAAFGAVLLAGAGFAEMLEALDPDEELGRFDDALARTLRSEMGAASLQAFALLTRLGDTITLTLLCIVVTAWLLWRKRRVLALGYVVAVAGNGVLIRVLKRVFERVRPPHEGLPVSADGFSFPSGHSAGAVVAYGMLVYVALNFTAPRWHAPLLLAATALALSIGVSRVMLQVHYASDVLAGFAFGLLWLGACVVSLEWTQRWRARA